MKGVFKYAHTLRKFDSSSGPFYGDMRQDKEQIYYLSANGGPVPNTVG